MGEIAYQRQLSSHCLPRIWNLGPAVKNGTNPEMVDLHSSSKKHVRITMQLPNRSIAVFLLSDKEEINSK